MRRLSTIVVAVALLVTAGCSMFAARDAQAATERSAGAVEVIKISGLLDPILADFLATSLDRAVTDDALAVVLRIDSSDAVISDERLVALARQIHDSPVPVVAWVGPAGSHAEGATAQLLAVADSVGLAPGSAIGNIGEVVVPLSLWSDAWRDARTTLQAGRLGPDDAAAKGLAVVPKQALVLRNMLLTIDGFRATAKGGTPATPVQFGELSTTRTAMHTFASPAVAALMLAIGLSLLLFEFYTAGVGIAGVTGAVCLLFAAYGLGVLPVRPVAVAVIVAAMVAFAVDVQVGVPRVWTAIGSVALAAGFVLLFDGVAVPWPAVVGSIVGVILFMFYGMPAMTRSRFSTPMIERTWLVGQRGNVVEPFDPDGVIRVDGALWAGRSDESLAVGAPVRIVGVDGVLCLVESGD